MKWAAVKPGGQSHSSAALNEADASLLTAFAFTGLQSARALVERKNHGSLGPYWEDIKQLAAGESDTLLLFRRRGEALGASVSMGVVPHRLRMSGLPVCVHGWIAVLLWDWTKPDLDKTDFDQLWNERVGSSGDERASHAWSVLVRAFGRSASRISVTRLVTKLASGSPTYDLTLPEFGYVGPIISTIHGSKGREASDVRLYLPGPSSGDTADDELGEEARIVFVGATRAHVIPDHAGNTIELTRAKIPSPAFYLLRPDGHVGLAGGLLQPGVVAGYLADRLQMGGHRTR